MFKPCIRIRKTRNSAPSVAPPFQRPRRVLKGRTAPIYTWGINKGAGSYHLVILAEELGGGQELIKLVEGHDGLRQLSEVQLQQRSYRVHICVTAETDKTETGGRGAVEVTIYYDSKAWRQEQITMKPTGDTSAGNGWNPKER